MVAISIKPWLSLGTITPLSDSDFGSLELTQDSQCHGVLPNGSSLSQSSVQAGSDPSISLHRIQPQYHCNINSNEKKQQIARLL